jgi:hypothetical protein
MDVWAIVYGNYDPPELHSLWESEELAEAVRAQLDDEAWQVIERHVGTQEDCDAR